MSSGSRRNSSNPNVPSGRTNTSTQRSTAGVDALATTVQDGSKREDTSTQDMCVAGARRQRPPAIIPELVRRAWLGDGGGPSLDADRAPWRIQDGAAIARQTGSSRSCPTKGESSPGGESRMRGRGTSSDDSGDGRPHGRPRIPGRASGASAGRSGGATSVWRRDDHPCAPRPGTTVPRPERRRVVVTVPRVRWGSATGGAPSDVYAVVVAPGRVE